MDAWFDHETLRLLVQTLVGFLGIFVFLRWWEPRMMYYPNHPTRELGPAPTLPFQSRRILTQDGEHVHLWQLTQPEPDVPVVVFCHGNAGNLSDRREKAELLYHLGADVLLFDYRGYGQSSGKPSERGTYLDGEAVLETLRGRMIYLYGESLGTGVATELALRHPEVNGLILEAGFTSIPDVAQRIFWFLPVRWLVKNRYENRKKLPRIHCPLLLLHSRDDTVFRFPHAEKLLVAANAPKELVALRGPHGDPMEQSATVYRDSLQAFLLATRVQ